ncbi:uncharacterized protein PFL1_00635 [Pseudozyma flocculosa PF-1]|uniref:Trafficking protein particle complex subunit 2-like protein n=1 Tax=Pseudozyma flocculosa TaxID=84751 RepID=A0A5C3ESU7_9BASI|nr:uncharacterized protein PFL1_00635 [Pseudozyma flocculosa PF-1]EPQ32439.1 hypothetical protein PFL1_00635 [Pseudozyma flocculosa PF-1]SPO34577.1 uncharacterized protein PSFLO_00048 [Pseudozyma flocculosa]
MSFSASPRIQAIAVLSPRNTPVYVRHFQHGRAPASSSASSSTASKATNGADLRYHYFAHAATDVMDERTAHGRNAEQYLGLLYTLEDLAVYGFQTSTRVRFMVMLSLTDHLVRDIDVLTIFRALHTAYLSYISNPFHSLPPNPSALLSSPTDAQGAGPDGGAEPERTAATLFAMQDASLPLKVRQIRSPAFDKAVERIVGLRSEPPAASSGTAEAAGHAAGGRTTAPVAGAS